MPLVDESGNIISSDGGGSWWEDPAPAQYTGPHYDPLTGKYYMQSPSGARSYLPNPSSGGGSTSVTVQNTPIQSQGGRYITSVDTTGSITGYPGSTYQQDTYDGSITIINKGTTTNTKDANGDGYDDTTGLPNGVVKVDKAISWTGLVYQGIPVNADGSPAGPAPAEAPKAPRTGIVQTSDGSDWLVNLDTGQKISQIGGPTPIKPVTSGGSATTPSSAYSSYNTGSSSGGNSTSYKSPYQTVKLPDGSIGIFDPNTGQIQTGVAAGEMGPEPISAYQQSQIDYQQQQLALQYQQLGLSQQQAAAKAAQDAKDFGLNAANSLAQNVSLTDPLALPAFLAAGGGDMNNALAAGATALSPAALLPAARILEMLKGTPATTPPVTGQQPIPYGNDNPGTGIPPVTTPTGQHSAPAPVTPSPVTTPAATPAPAAPTRVALPPPSYSQQEWNALQHVPTGYNPNLTSGPPPAGTDTSTWNGTTWVTNTYGVVPVNTPTTPMGGIVPGGDNSASLTPQQAIDRAWASSGADVTGGYGSYASPNPAELTGTQLWNTQGGYVWDQASGSYKPYTAMAEGTMGLPLKPMAGGTVGFTGYNQYGQTAVEAAGQPKYAGNAAMNPSNFSINPEIAAYAASKGIQVSPATLGSWSNTNQVDSYIAMQNAISQQQNSPQQQATAAGINVIKQELYQQHPELTNTHDGRMKLQAMAYQQWKQSQVAAPAQSTAMPEGSPYSANDWAQIQGNPQLKTRYEANAAQQAQIAAGTYDPTNGGTFNPTWSTWGNLTTWDPQKGWYNAQQGQGQGAGLPLQRTQPPVTNPNLLVGEEGPEIISNPTQAPLDVVNAPATAAAFGVQNTKASTNRLRPMAEGTIGEDGRLTYTSSLDPRLTWTAPATTTTVAPTTTYDGRTTTATEPAPTTTTAIAPVTTTATEPIATTEPVRTTAIAPVTTEHATTTATAEPVPAKTPYTAPAGNATTAVTTAVPDTAPHPVTTTETATSPTSTETRKVIGHPEILPTSATGASLLAQGYTYDPTTGWASVIPGATTPTTTTPTTPTTTTPPVTNTTPTTNTTGTIPTEAATQAGVFPGASPVPISTLPQNPSGYGVSPLNLADLNLSPTDQAWMEQILGLRLSTQVPQLNPYELGWNTLDPTLRGLFMKARQSKYGIPVNSQEFDIAKNALPTSVRPVTTGY